VPCAVADIFAAGGEGGRELAREVVEHAERKVHPFTPLYDLAAPIKEKVERIARRMYGATSVEYTRAAERDLAEIARLGYAGLPVCMAKTPNSLTDDPRVVGRPESFDITVSNVILAAGAGFVVPLLGEIIRMPGLPTQPRAERVDLVDGQVEGLLEG
jgi:formate--tetrahydrofolate ligase